MKNIHFLLLIVIIFLQQALVGVSFGQSNKTVPVNQTKKDTTLRHYHLRFDYNLLIDSYNSIIRDYNKYINTDGLNCAKLVSGNLNKINLILANEDSLNAKEFVWTLEQNLQILGGDAKVYSLSVMQADQLIASNVATIQKINLFIKNPNDNEAFNAWAESCKNTILLFQKFVKD